MTTAKPQPERAWQRMLSGRRLDLLKPDPADITIEDIAHGLARVARWNGQTIGPHAFSVAQHSIVVVEILEAMQPHYAQAEFLAALLHDAPEYVIGDLISPFKSAIGLDYKAFELRLLSAIHRRFELPDPLASTVTAAIKEADRVAAYFEATRLAGFDRREADEYFSHPDIPPALAARLESLASWPVPTAEQRFLERFSQLARR